MKFQRAALLALTLAFAAASSPAQTIWKWRDANGTLQISDQPPPTSVPEKNIVARPNVGRAAVIVPDLPASEASAPVARADGELEARKRKQQTEKAAAESARQQAEKERLAGRKADECRRARNHMTMLESGIRVARPNDKGEREILDDRGRAEEMERTRQAVAANCQ